MTEHTTQTPVSAHPSPELGPAPDALISSAIAKIQNAHLPIAIVGMKASRPAAANATRALLKHLVSHLLKRIKEPAFSQESSSLNM